MSWYNEAIFYHIYPLGLTGAPAQNDYGAPAHRLNTLLPWIDTYPEDWMYSTVYRSVIRKRWTWI